MRKLILCLALVIPAMSCASETNAVKVEGRSVAGDVLPSQPSIIQQSPGTTTVNKSLDPCGGSNRVKRSCQDTHPIRGY